MCPFKNHHRLWGFSSQEEEEKVGEGAAATMISRSQASFSRKLRKLPWQVSTASCRARLLGFCSSLAAPWLQWAPVKWTNLVFWHSSQ